MSSSGSRWQCCRHTGGGRHVASAEQEGEISSLRQRTTGQKLVVAMSSPMLQTTQWERVVDGVAKQQERVMDDNGRQQKKSYGGRRQVVPDSSTVLNKLKKN
jgi:hypothetical protein